MANRSSNKTAVPEAKGALDKFKYEVASELGVPLSDGYNGDLTSRQNGLMNFKLGDIYQDAKILQMANEAADQLTEEDEEWIRKLPNYENAAGVVI